MPTVAELGEFGLIAHLTKHLSTNTQVVTGIGDDVAVLAVAANSVLLATCDAQVEGTHFRLNRSQPFDIGWKALAVNLSDIAAMGGQPRFALISLLVPTTTDISLLEGIYAGLQAAAQSFDTAIVGGNVARNEERLIIDVTVLGTAAPNRILHRSGAQPGDAIFVTGTLGESAAGLLVQEDVSLAQRLTPEVASKALAAQQLPQPQVAAGLWLAENGATAALDVSDGLAADLAHLCTASGVGATLTAELLPISAITVAVAMASGRTATNLALYGGEDYVLLFTVPATLATTLAERARAEVGASITQIGYIHQENHLAISREGQLAPLHVDGWDHMMHR